MSMEELKKEIEGEEKVIIHTQVLYDLMKQIEKQQKEIEDLKQDRDKFKKALGKRITYCNELEKDLFENCSNYVISKSKIQDKIDELEKEYQNVKEKYDLSQYISMSGYEILQKNQGYIKVLQKLLEEE